MSALYFFYSLTPWTLLFLRISLGAIFIVHGTPKIRMAEKFAPGMGMSPGMVKLVGIIETVGGILVLLGLFTQLGAIGIAVIMAGALHYKINKWHAPFTAMDKTGWELDLIFLAAALLLMSSGGGMLSVDWMLLGVY